MVGWSIWGMSFFYFNFKCAGEGGGVAAVVGGFNDYVGLAGGEVNGGGKTTVGVDYCHLTIDGDY